MMAWLRRQIDGFRGSGASAATVPPMDGALRPNTALESARIVARLAGVDCLAASDGMVWASSGHEVSRIDPATGAVVLVLRFDRPVTCIAANGETLAVGQDDGSVTLMFGDGKRVIAPFAGGCLTALAFQGSGLVACTGSAEHPVGAWQRDLMQGGASGSVWEIPPEGAARQLAGGLAWPCGVALSGGQVVVAEAWRHRLVTLDGRAVLADLPGYPGRLAPAGDGWWLSVFAPRNQLTEFVLREPEFRARMLRDLRPEHWVCPTLHPARSFLEPLQGGAIRTHGIVKPWAPTRSYGLLVRLDAGFQPLASYHSRADGRFHGVTAALQIGAEVLVAAKGGDALLALGGVA